MTKPYGVMTLGRWGRDRATQARRFGIAYMLVASSVLEQDGMEPGTPCMSTSTSPELLPCAVLTSGPTHQCFSRMSREGMVNRGCRLGVTMCWKMSLELLSWSEQGQSITSRRSMVGLAAAGALPHIYALQAALIALHAVTPGDTG